MYYSGPAPRPLPYCLKQAFLSGRLTAFISEIVSIIHSLPHIAPIYLHKRYNGTEGGRKKVEFVYQYLHLDLPGQT